ncbi:MAG: hypothetical protein MZV63_19875 [Marinilabiliales bacterium]|nr:hypothetical protein [Marinilabiliales bacterium]
MGFYATSLVACGGSRTRQRRSPTSWPTWNEPYVRGEHLYERARILAALGDADGAVRALDVSWPMLRAGTGIVSNCTSTCAGTRSRRSPSFIELMKPKG